MVSFGSTSDRQLLESLKQDSEAAFKAIYERYWQKLLNAAFKRLQDQDLCEDIVQNIFLSLWVRRHELQINDLAAYLQVSVRNRVLDHFKSDKGAVSLYEPMEEMVAGTEAADSSLVTKELLALILTYSETLPPKRKQIFLMYIKDRLSTAEIAQILEVSPHTVKNQLATALKGIRQDLVPIVLALIFSKI